MNITFDCKNEYRNKKIDKWLVKNISSEIMSRHISNEMGYYPK